MNLLLDTHIWLWSLEDHKRLGRRVSEELGNPQNQKWLSPISTWEVLMLNAKGRIRLPADYGAWIAQATSSLKASQRAQASVSRFCPTTSAGPSPVCGGAISDPFSRRGRWSRSGGGKTRGRCRSTWSSITSRACSGKTVRSSRTSSTSHGASYDRGDAGPNRLTIVVVTRSITRAALNAAEPIKNSGR